MYVRRSRPPLTPPVNYAGVAFSKDQPTSEGISKDTKIHKALPPPASKSTAPIKEEELVIPQQTSENEAPKTDDTSPTQASADTEDMQKTPEKEGDRAKALPKGILSDFLDGKFTIEDILLFASLFLLVSGQIDDEILLLAGVLLLLRD